MKMYHHHTTYCKISNIRGTKSKNLNVSLLGLQLSLCNILKPSVKWSIIKLLLEQRRQAMLQLHLGDLQFNSLLKCVLYKRLDGKFLQSLFPSKSCFSYESHSDSRYWQTHSEQCLSKIIISDHRSSMECSREHVYH